MFDEYQEPNEMFFAQVKEDGSFILLKRKVDSLNFNSITLKNGFTELLFSSDYQYFVNLTDACKYIQNKLLIIRDLQKKIINNCDEIPDQYESGTQSDIYMFCALVLLDGKARITKKGIRIYDDQTVTLIDGTEVPRKTSDQIYCLDQYTATQFIQSKRKVITDNATFVLSNSNKSFLQCKPENYEDLVAY